MREWQAVLVLFLRLLYLRMIAHCKINKRLTEIHASFYLKSCSSAGEKKYKCFGLKTVTFCLVKMSITAFKSSNQKHCS